MAGEALVFMLVLLAVLAISIGLPLWTYADASKNSDHPAFLWALVVFLTPLLGIVLYLLLGKRSGGGTYRRNNIPAEYRR